MGSKAATLGKKHYVSPYKASQPRIRKIAAARKAAAAIQQPQMMFAGESYSPVRGTTGLAVTAESPSPSKRLKGSFMNPTASKLLKEVSRTLLQDQSLFNSMRFEESQRRLRAPAAKSFGSMRRSVAYPS